MKYKNRGLSMMEIIIVVVIIGIMAIIFGNAGNQSAFERQRGKEAISNLQLIHNAQKRFLLEKGFYYICNPNPCTRQGIMDNLTFMIDTSNFVYSIVNLSTAVQPGYRAEAVRSPTATLCGGMHLNLTHNNSTVRKGCVQW